MPCYAPLKGYYSAERNWSTGKRKIVFDRKQSLSGAPVTLPCGGCIGCRLDKAHTWAVRCMHEKKMHKFSSFLTLTYNDENVPPDGSLVLDDLQRFMKRLRHVSGTGLRFFGCGEYGDITNRPHYHLLLLNYDFSDKKFFKNSPAGQPYYVSATLDKLWPVGFHTVAAVDYDSCAYVARYVTKKVTGERAGDWYQGRQPEFCVMSRRPGLGYAYYMRYAHEIFAHDSIVFNGRETKVPRFYDDKYKMLDSKFLEELKEKRRRRAIENGRADNTVDRRRVREVFAERTHRSKKEEMR